MPDKIAEYCEAYLITPGLCKVATKCCVSRDIYPDKVPADLRVPIAHFPHKNSTQKYNNNTSQSQSHSQHQVIYSDNKTVKNIIKYNFIQITTKTPTTTQPTTTTEPIRSKVNPSTRPTRPAQTKQRPTEAIEEEQSNNQKDCAGECVGGLFALFCDDLDSDAFCPNEGSCCITGADAQGTNNNKVTAATTRRPATPVSDKLIKS